MAPDRVIPYQELIKGDPRHDLYDGGITTDWIQESLAEMRESPLIPDAVRHQLSLARQLCIAGWFLWDLYVVAVHYTTVACEVAIRHRFVESLDLPIRLIRKRQEPVLLTTSPDPNHFIEHLRTGLRLPGRPDFRGTFRQLVNWGLTSGAIPRRDEVRWDATIGLRNTYAHGSQSILPLNFPLSVLQRSVWTINALFPDPATAAHDAPLIAADEAEAEELDRLLREGLPESSASSPPRR